MAGGVVVDPEVLVSLFVVLGAPGDALDRLARLWDRCGSALGMDHPMSGGHVPVDRPVCDWEGRGDAVLAGRQDKHNARQAVLRRASGVVELSVLLGRGAGWADLAAEGRRWLGDDAAVPHSVVVVLVGESDPGAADVPLPGPWSPVRRFANGLALTEIGRGGDSRRQRSMVATAQVGRSDALTWWLWGGNVANQPPFAAYSTHLAKVRYSLRTFQRAEQTATLCAELDAAAARVGAALTSVERPEDVLSAVQDGRGRVLVRLGRLKTMRRTVEIAEDNAVRALGGQAGRNTPGDPITDDLALISWFRQQLDDDITYLEAADDSARRTVELLETPAAPVPRRRAALPTFGIITDSPAALAAVRTLLDGQVRREFLPHDRSAYFRGELPSAVADVPHQVVALLTDPGPLAAADACSHLARSFGSVNCVIVVGDQAVAGPAGAIKPGDVVIATGADIDGAHGRPRPSPLLIRCVRLLMADELVGERSWEQWIARGESAGGFRRPAGRPGHPVVHHGRPGTEVPELLAVEREAVGVGGSGFATGLEWLVVRGIGDVAEASGDPYAALTAAAYARALLGVCPPMAPRGGHTGAG